MGRTYRPEVLCAVPCRPAFDVRQVSRRVVTGFILGAAFALAAALTLATGRGSPPHRPALTPPLTQLRDECVQVSEGWQCVVKGKVIQPMRHWLECLRCSCIPLSRSGTRVPDTGRVRFDWQPC